jgi:hypothetical protein
MSTCERCEKEMHPADAAQYHVCQECQKAMFCDPRPVRTLDSPGHHAIRPQYNTRRLFSEAPEGTRVGDNDDE